MPFISVADDLAKKSVTQIENKFIIKYLPALDCLAAKVYIYSLYLWQSGSKYTLGDLAKSFDISEEQAVDCFKSLEEFELVSIISREPFEVKILEAENISGRPKKINPEKYSDFAKTVQEILKGRMISTNEFTEYFCLMDEKSIEENALIMIIKYCALLHGDKIGAAYIKKVVKNFIADGDTTAKKVEERLSDFSAATPSLLNIFAAVGIKKQHEIDDDKLYKKWTGALGFDNDAIIAAAKSFKAKTVEKIDAALEELYKNKKFDPVEIADYCKNKNSVYNLTLDIAKSLGVYMQTSAPYVENYVNAWCNYGFGFDCLKNISAFCFKHDMKSFEEMDAFVKTLYDDGVIDDGSVNEFIDKRNADDKLLKQVLALCGLTRKIVPWDRESLEKWRSWSFSDEMLCEAAKISSGKSNPLAYMNGVLSSWKQNGIFTKDEISPAQPPHSSGKSWQEDGTALRTEIERHYYDLRHAAEQRAEQALSAATADTAYGAIRKRLNELSIELAFAELRDKKKADEISADIKELELNEKKRLAELCIDKDDFIPHYACNICNDTGYDKLGNPCSCLKQFIATLK